MYRLVCFVVCQFSELAKYHICALNSLVPKISYTYLNSQASIISVVQMGLVGVGEVSGNIQYIVLHTGMVDM